MISDLDRFFWNCLTPTFQKFARSSEKCQSPNVHQSE